MEILMILLVFFGGISLGGVIMNLFSIYSEKRKIENKIKDINEKFSQILKNISQNKSIFKNRVNNTIYIGSGLKEYGLIDIIYMMDNKLISIFKDGRCIYTSESVNPEILSDISIIIENKYKNEINNFVSILGFKFYRVEFEKNFNVDELKRWQNIGMNEVSDIDKIKEENKIKLDVDDILDKINKDGMESLTFEEMIFLDEQSKDGK